ncbi:uncharacterized protein LOC120169346 [Hibiscus syriacus]|uniref:uncharacterized protein LOC120169346 n=1 Tax=Hibiscus syriacus TaxID=106335 RepID=UPI00192482A1|nr:uncharacterized protein LOC120169346 [Hibiscus syriacus]
MSWEVIRFNVEHACTMTSLKQNHKHLDSDVICSYVKLVVEKNPRVFVFVLVASIRNTFGYITTYYKAWMAKRKAMTLWYGNWDQSYNELPRLLQAMKFFIPGTIVRYYTHTAITLEGDVIPKNRIFDGLLWAFKPAIERFRFCKQMIQVDGTFLYGLYRNVLMIVVAQDGDRNIFPIAFAIVKKESEETWNFIISNLCSHVVTQAGVCMISDRSSGLLSTIGRPENRWTPPHGYLAYSIRHIASNAMKRFKQKNIKKEIINMGYALLQPNFRARLENLRRYEDDVYEFAAEIPIEIWSQAYDVKGRRYDHMTTNLAECINSVLKMTRRLPIASIVRETYFRLGKVWAEKSSQIDVMISDERNWALDLEKAMQKNQTHATSIFVHNFARLDSDFVVQALVRPHEGGNSTTYTSNLNRRWCDRGRFQAFKFPCAHAVVTCMHINVDPYFYVDYCYSLHTMRNIYSCDFKYLPNEAY